MRCGTTSHALALLLEPRSRRRELAWLSSDHKLVDGCDRERRSASPGGLTGVAVSAVDRNRCRTGCTESTPLCPSSSTGPLGVRAPPHSHLCALLFLFAVGPGAEKRRGDPRPTHRGGS